LPEVTYREAVRDALAHALREDEDVFVMGEDIAEMGGSMGVTQGLLDEFGPGRIRNTPISEIAITGAAIGAATGAIAGAVLPGIKPGTGAVAGAILGGVLGAAVNGRQYYRDTRGYCYYVDQYGQPHYSYDIRC